MKILLLLCVSFLAFSSEHIRKNDLVVIKHKDQCMKEEDFFNNCDKVKVFKVQDFVLDTYYLVPKNPSTCEKIEIDVKYKEECLEVVHERKISQN